MRPPGTTAEEAAAEEDEEQRTMKKGRSFPNIKWVLLGLEKAAKWSSCFSLIGCNAPSIFDASASSASLRLSFVI